MEAELEYVDFYARICVWFQKVPSYSCCHVENIFWLFVDLYILFATYKTDKKLANQTCVQKWKVFITLSINSVKIYGDILTLWALFSMQGEVVLTGL